MALKCVRYLSKLAGSYLLPERNHVGAAEAEGNGETRAGLLTRTHWL